MSAIKDLILDAFKQADHILFALCMFASGFGVVLIYSATRYKSALHGNPMKQVIAIVIGIVLYFAFSQLNIDVLRVKWKWLMLFCTALILLLRTPLGIDVNGNRAWLSIPHVPFTLQPAELDKVFFTILLAALIVFLKQNSNINKITSVLLMAGLLLYFIGLLYVMSGDMGSCLIYVVIFAVLLWAGGLSKIWFALGIGTVGAAVWYIWPKIPDDYYQKLRILVCFDHDLDPQGTGFQQGKALIAIRSGGLTGCGYMKGALTQSALTSRLPERYNDFIFSSCCEEWGLVGAAFVIILLMAIILRIIYIGWTAPDEFSSLMCIGYAGMFLAQIAFNIGMNLYVMPVIGLTLPFISYGGTSIMVNFMIMGLISGVKNRKQPEWVKNSETPERRKSVLYTPGNKNRRQYINN